MLGQRLVDGRDGGGRVLADLVLGGEQAASVVARRNLVLPLG